MAIKHGMRFLKNGVIVAIAFAVAFSSRGYSAQAAPTLSILSATYPSLPAPSGDIVDMVQSGNYLYTTFAQAGTNAFRIIDVSTVTVPTVRGGSGLSFAGLPKHLAISGHYVFAGDVTSGGGGVGVVHVIDIANPDAPAFVGGTLSYTNGDIKDLIISGNYLYVATSNGLNTKWFHVVDISNPLAMSEVGTVSSLATGPDLISKSGNYVFAPYSDSSGVMKVIDVSTPASPSVVGTLSGLPAAAIKANIVSGNYLYLVFFMSGTSVLRVIDISNPLAPSVVGGTAFTITQLPLAAVLSGTNLFLSAGTVDPIMGTVIDPMILTVDVSSPTNPTSSTSLAMVVGLPGAMISSGSYLYLLNQSVLTGIATDGMRIVNVVTSSGGGRILDYTPPDAPTKLTASSDGKTAHLTWVDPIAKDLNRIEVFHNNGGNTPINGGNIIGVILPGVQTYTDTQVTPGITYQYQLRAVDSAANISVSDIVSVTIAPPTVSTPPASPSPTPEPVSPTPNIPTPISPPIPVIVAPVWDANAFSQSGTSGTKSLNTHERGDLWADYVAIYGKTPSADEMDTMGKGHIVAPNSDWEKQQIKTVLPVWQKLTGKRTMARATTREKAMYDVLMYRLRFPRDLTKEQLAIARFRKLFGHVPANPLAWTAMRALAYTQ